MVMNDALDRRFCDGVEYSLRENYCTARRCAALSQ